MDLDFDYKLPETDEIEITIIGPGYGESCIVHIGGGRWLIVDSCVDSEQNAVLPLEYLRRLGVDVANDVSLVVATHWHDDHIKGLAKVVQECAKAQFCASSAMKENEFLGFLSSYGVAGAQTSFSAVSEIVNVMDIIKDRGPAKLASADRPLLAIEGKDGAGTLNCRVTALSPSDQQILLSMAKFAELAGQATKKGQRPKAISPNNCSVVLWISIGNVNILLGADLEEHNVGNLGWECIVNSTTKPGGTAKIFKIPHHGSQNGHHPRVWSEMVSNDDPIAVLTPWRKGGRSLPTQADRDRICQLADNSFTTSLGTTKKTIQRDPTIERMIRSVTVGGIKREEMVPGLVRVRIPKSGKIKIECSSVAGHLAHMTN